MSEPSFGDTVTAFSAANDAAGDSTPAAPQDSPANIPTFSQEQAPQQTQPTGSNPAYAEYLSKIPEGFRGVVEPIFKEWDAGVNRRFEQVHSKYEPYKFLAERQENPDNIRQAMELQRLLVEDPKRVYEALAEHYGSTPGQGQALDEPEEEFDLGEGGQPQQFDITKHPQFVQLQQQMQSLVQGMQQEVQQREATQAAAEGEQWLENRMNAATSYLKEKFQIEPGKEDWNYILGTAAGLASGVDNPTAATNDAAFAQAVDAYVAQVNRFRGMRTANSSAPTVLPTGGGTPSNVISNELSDRDRRKLAVDMFSQALKDA